jgi:hypothetical protein
VEVKVAINIRDPRLTVENVRTALWAELRVAALERRRKNGWPVTWTERVQADWTWHPSAKIKVAQRLLGSTEVHMGDVDFGGAEWMLEVAVAEMLQAGVLAWRPPELDRFHITPHGMRCLEADDPAFPLDATGRVEALRAEFNGAPDLALMCHYLSEAIEAYGHNLTLAAATMIGCAYELALLDLASAVVRRWAPATVPSLSRKLREAGERHAKGDYAQAGMLADVVYESIKANSGVLGTDEWRWVASCFNPTFFIVRELRNDAGHPSGNAVARDEVFTHIVNLGPTYRHVRAIIAML